MKNRIVIFGPKGKGKRDFIKSFTKILNPEQVITINDWEREDGFYLEIPGKIRSNTKVLIIKNLKYLNSIDAFLNFITYSEETGEIVWRNDEEHIFIIKPKLIFILDTDHTPESLALQTGAKRKNTMYIHVSEENEEPTELKRTASGRELYKDFPFDTVKFSDN